MPRSDSHEMPILPWVGGLPLPCFLPRGMAPPGGGALPLSGLTVLLVEDSRFASDAVRLMCNRSGARLRRVETLAQARAHLDAYHPDVVIIDLGLPDGRGDGLIREVVQAGQGSLVLGTSGDPEGRNMALAAGALGFLDKPIPGLAAFQRAILRHLPKRFAILATGALEEGVIADPLALQDDLAHAADLLGAAANLGQRRYLASFLCGLARVVGDTALAEAARALMYDAGAMVPLGQMIRARLAEGEPF